MMKKVPAILMEKLLMKKILMKKKFKKVLINFLPIHKSSKYISKAQKISIFFWKNRKKNISIAINIIRIFLEKKRKES